MTGIRFARVELRYGRHATAFDLRADASGAPRPFVILGPNGAGKSTLVEALLRTLFGFRRVKQADRTTHDLRRPWAGGGYRGSVRILVPDGAVTFERDFDSDEVRVTREGREAPLFEEEANPARGGESIRRYRELLERTIGLTELKQYRRTACVFQGGLLGTDLSLDLLRVAAGGHADVESAHARLDQEYRRLTVEPIAPDASRRRKEGTLEAARREVGELEAARGEARAAERRRLPLVRRRDELSSRGEKLAGEIDRLELAFETLSEADRLEMEVAAGRARIRTLEGAAVELDEALARFELVADRARAAGPRYPDDFEARARMLDEALWPRRDEIEDELARLAAADVPAAPGGGRALLAGLVLVAAAGTALTLGGRTGLGLLLAIPGALGAAAVWARARADRGRAAERAGRVAGLREAREETARRIDVLLEGVPGAASLDRASLPGHRREFARERGELELVADAERRLRGSMDAARGAVEAADEDGGERGAGDAPRPSRAEAGELRQRARDVLRALRDRIAAERDEVLAPLTFRLGERSRSRFDLPDDVEATLESVRRARRRRLEESEEIRAELASIERELSLEGRSGGSALSLERDLEAARERAAGLAARAAAYRRAHALIAEAYESFRRTDEERLVGAISGHLTALSGGELGPLETGDGLEGATLRVGERSLPLASPPLSYGQLHAALLAVRIGAADFLAGLGLRVPLLIDDPFVHLDERSAGDLWRLLERVSADRQVIIATQDRLVLEHLGVRPDLELTGPRIADAAGRGAGSPGSEEASGPAAPGSEGAAAEPGEGGPPVGEGRADPPPDVAAEADRGTAGPGEPGARSPAAVPLDLWGEDRS